MAQKETKTFKKTFKNFTNGIRIIANSIISFISQHEKERLSLKTIGKLGRHLKAICL